ncbi:MAG: DUF4861 family protein, partial [Bacteroides sp.]
MKKNFLPLLILLCGCSVAVFAQKSEQKTITVEVSNHWNQSKTDEPVVIQLNKLSTGFRIKSATVMDGTTEIPSQLDDLNNDRQPDELAFVLNLPAKSKKRVTIHLSNAKSTKTYEPRVYAEMLVSDKRGKHVPVHSVTIPGTSNIYNQMHHHGPAMESELVAYRLYFDQKQTVDIYGKFNKGFEIKESQFYP